MLKAIKKEPLQISSNNVQYASNYPPGIGFNSPTGAPQQKRINIFNDKKAGIPPKSAKVDHNVRTIAANGAITIQNG